MQMSQRQQQTIASAMTVVAGFVLDTDRCAGHAGTVCAVIHRAVVIRRSPSVTTGSYSARYSGNVRRSRR